MLSNIKGLLCPSGAVSSCTVTLCWEKNANFDWFILRQDGHSITRTRSGSFLVRGLKAGTEYAFSVACVWRGKETPLGSVTVRTLDEGPILDIRDYGAKNGGDFMCTAAIQSAIDAAPSNGTVLISGGTYLSGALFLKGDMTLRIDGDAKLMGSMDTADYPLMNYRFEGLETLCYASLLNTRDGDAPQNLRIIGSGTIDASGEALRAREISELAGKPGRAVCLRNGRNVYLEDVTIRQSPAWCLHVIYSDSVTLSNVTILTKYGENGESYRNMVNGDGFNPDSCRGVAVLGCSIASEDDCIAIKSGRDEEGRRVGIPTEDVLVSDCGFFSGFGVCVGSEMAGGVRDVLVRDCFFQDTFSIASLKAPRGRGGEIARIRYERCSLDNSNPEDRDCRWFRGGINVDMFYSHENPDFGAAADFGEGTSVIRDIEFEDLDLRTVGGNAVFLAGLPESPLEGMRFVNVRARGLSGLKAYNVNGLTLEDCFFRGDSGPEREFSGVTIAGES